MSKANKSGQPSSHPSKGGNWPSTTGKPSGTSRGNASKGGRSNTPTKGK